MAAALGVPRLSTKFGDDSNHNHMTDNNSCSEYYYGTDSDSDLLSISSRTLSTGDISDCEEQFYHEVEQPKEEDNYSNDTRELHVIVEEHAEDEHEEEFNCSNTQRSTFSKDNTQCWNTGIQWVRICAR